MRKNAIWLLFSVMALIVGEAGQADAATYTVSVTGSNPVIAIAAGQDYTVALKKDGSVVAWGGDWVGQTDVPAGLNNVKAIAAGADHTVALKNDGSVVAWGQGWYGQTDIPAGLTDVKAIAAGGYHTVALKNDGTVAAWGYNGGRQTYRQSLPISRPLPLVTTIAWHSKTTAPSSHGGMTSMDRQTYRQD